MRQWRIFRNVLIIETPVFTRRITKLMSDDSYRALQSYLAMDPETGRLIQGSGGLRKLRWSAPGRGKRGGSRIIYYWITSKNTILMLMAFAKNERPDLSREQLRMLRKLVEEELK